MQYLVSIDSKGTRFCFQIAAKYVQCSVGHVICDKDLQLMPVIAIGYELDDLVIVSAITGEMFKRNIRPVVHIWDEHLPEGEVFVGFRLNDPSKGVIESTVEAVKGNRWGLIVPPLHLFTTGEASLSSEYIKAFLHLFAKTGMAIVVVYDASDAENFDGIIQETQKFLIHDVVRERPCFTSLF